MGTLVGYVYLNAALYSNVSLSLEFDSFVIREFEEKGGQLFFFSECLVWFLA